MGKYYQKADGYYETQRTLYYTNIEDEHHWILRLSIGPPITLRFSEYMTDTKLNTYKKIDLMINFLENINAKRSVIKEREWIIPTDSKSIDCWFMHLINTFQNKLEEWEEEEKENK